MRKPSGHGRRWPHHLDLQGEELHLQAGAPCDAAFYVLMGHVDLSVVSKQGKERVVGQLGPRAFIA
jgi:CRP-like cAMP-binding protein